MLQAREHRDIGITCNFPRSPTPTLFSLPAIAFADSGTTCANATDNKVYLKVIYRRGPTDATASAYRKPGRSVSLQRPDKRLFSSGSPR